MVVRSEKVGAGLAALVGEGLVYLIGSWIGSLLETDEISAEPMPDGSVRFEVLTSGISDTLCQIKTKIMMALANLPVKRVEIENIEAIPRGIITKRYKVTVRVYPLFSLAPSP